MNPSIRIIPCLDVTEGRVVKGINFTNLQDAGDPVEMARVYGLEGADELTFLDISASTGNRQTTYDVVSSTAEQVFIPLTVGGGVRTVCHGASCWPRRGRQQAQEQKIRVAHQRSRFAGPHQAH